MHTVHRRRSLASALVATLLAACSGSSGDDGTTLTLAATDAASDELSSFVIGIESVELQRAVGAPVELMLQPLAVDFAELSDLSRVLSVTSIPEDTYTGMEVVLNFDADRVFVVGSTAPAALLDSDGNPLTGTMTLPVQFPVPLLALTGNIEIELDLDLDQSVVVDALNNEVQLEPTLVPRLNPGAVKEHAVGGSLRTVVLERDLFRIGLGAPVGQLEPVVTVEVGPGTVFQVNGICLVGIAGLSELDNLAPGSWVQAFGSVGSTPGYFDALTVEAGTGSYNGGTDIVEGLITGRTGADLAVRGHSNNSTHTVFEFNLNFTAAGDLANTKVVRRGSATLYDLDDLNVGQRVRVFGLLDTFNNTIDVSTATDVVRAEPTHVFAIANGAPAGGLLSVDVTRIDLRDVSLFNWAQGGATPADPDNMVLDVGNLGTGQGITAGTPIEAVGFFSPLDDAGPDFLASTLANHDLRPSLLLVRDRANGMTVTPTIASTHVDFAFAGAATGFEKAVIDQGFVGETDVTGTGIRLEQVGLGLGLFVIRDRTLQTVAYYLSFATFSQALQTALTSGATVFNVGAVGAYDSASDSIASALVGVVLQ
jgi:hypothetical protein